MQFSYIADMNCIARYIIDNQNLLFLKPYFQFLKQFLFAVFVYSLPPGVSKPCGLLDALTVSRCWEKRHMEKVLSAFSFNVSNDHPRTVSNILRMFTQSWYHVAWSTMLSWDGCNLLPKQACVLFFVHLVFIPNWAQLFKCSNQYAIKVHLYVDIIMSILWTNSNLFSLLICCGVRFCYIHPLDLLLDGWIHTLELWLKKLQINIVEQINTFLSLSLQLCHFGIIQATSLYKQGYASWRDQDLLVRVHWKTAPAQVSDKHAQELLCP